MQWETVDTPFHIHSVPLPALRAALSDASGTTPYLDIIEYPMNALLNDEHSSILAHFYDLLLSGHKVEALHLGDFTLLPKKSPRGVVVNGCPLSNLPVLWKLFFMVITQALQIWLVQHGRISCIQMAGRWPTSTVDPLCVVSDWIQQ